jgi:uncharacterized protein YbjT (DUF2867 family)
MYLIVGATGLLGSEICRQLAGHGEAVRALVRGTSDPGKVAELTALGVEAVRGDLKDAATLREACRGASAIVSTASSTISRQPGDSIQSVDGQGQLDLVEAAADAGVGHFVLISFPEVGIDFPLQRAKRAVEDRLRRSGMTHTILQPTCFMEVWLSPALGFDPAHAKARIYGDGRNRISWISFRDVARFTVAGLAGGAARNVTVKLGGPEALSPLEVVRLAERSLGKAVAVEHVPEAALRAQLDASTEPLQQSLAGLMLYCARGDVIDMTDTCEAFSVRQLKSVRDLFPAPA